MKPLENDPRLERAVDLKRKHPRWSIQRIAREAGGLCKVRCRLTLVEAGLLRPRDPHDRLAAPDWYHRPTGRIVAQRQAQGIKP